MNVKLLKKYLTYNKETGIFIWNLRRGRAQKGQVAGQSNKMGYRYIRINGKLYAEHRLAWLYEYGKIAKNKVIDHKNGVTSDNRICNLRPISHIENSHNSFKRRGKSKFIGITWDYNKWVARIRIKGKRLEIGRFINPNDAAQAYLEAKNKYHKSWLVNKN